MKLFAAALAATALFASLARADESITGQAQPDSRDSDRVYVATGVGMDLARRVQAGYQVELGVRLPSLPIWAHGYASQGESGFLFDHGSYQQVRGGLETRGCTSGRLVCGFAGVDVGYNVNTGVDESWGGPGMDYVEHDVVTSPRVGVEIGRRLRARLELSTPAEKNLDADENGRPLAIGLALHAGLGYQF